MMMMMSDIDIVILIGVLADRANKQDNTHGHHFALQNKFSKEEFLYFFGCYRDWVVGY
ncbi:MAG: hypothetical protein SGI98_11345 [Verrucomicrobiota bacterium]|nr:hypothetical protein [Verrucomicrobiota bacterium]